MAQVLEFSLPDLGEGLTEALIVRWLVEVGEVVAVDQPVVEVETAKAMVDVPCPYGGVVTARFGEEGTELPVGAPLVTVAVGTPAHPDPTGDAAQGSGNVLVGYGTSEAPARRRRVQREQTAPAAPVVLKSTDVQAPASTRATPTRHWCFSAAGARWKGTRARSPGATSTSFALSFPSKRARPSRPASSSPGLDSSPFFRLCLGRSP